MTTYYADFDLATGNNNGADAANAWQTFADALAGTNKLGAGSHEVPQPGDTVLCKGTDSSSFSAHNPNCPGTASGGFVKFIGVDASWANVGGATRAVIDAGNRNVHIINCTNGPELVWFENFRFTNTNKSGSYHAVTFGTNYADSWNWINCIFDDCNIGMNNGTNYGRYHSYIRCAAYDNTNEGFYLRNCALKMCRASGNGVRGFRLQDCSVIGCVAYDNGDDGFYFYGGGANHCVAYNNTGNGFESTLYGGSNDLFGCRAAANSIGFNNGYASGRLNLMYCYGDNTTETGGYYDEILNNGANTVTLNGSDTDEGFASPSTDDYNLTSSATYRRSGITIP